MGNIVVEVGLDGLEHGGPIRPFRRAVVTDDVGGFGRWPGRQEGQRKQGQDKADGFHEKSLRFEKGRTFPGSGHQHQRATKYRRRMKDLRRPACCCAAKRGKPLLSSASDPSASAMAELQ